MRRLGFLSLLLSLSLLGAACGGDDVGAYCDAVTSSEGGGEMPSEEEVQEVRDSAPDEIADEVNMIADALDEFRETGDPSGLEDPDVVAAIETTEEFEAENCE